jgi:predicted pyridoxine 5'-phosphate oxidase superfamily flavin-nucleotide-binding protein
MAKLTEDMKSLLAGMQAYVGTVSAEGKPNIAMKGSIKVLDDEHIVFYELTGGRTWRNLQQNSWVVIVVSNWNKFEGYRFEGKAEIISDGPMFEDAKKMSEAAKIPVPAKAAIKVKIEEIYDMQKGGAKVS